MNWTAATDEQTPFSGLSYGVRVGSISGGIDIISPMADTVSGFRRLPQLGNAQRAFVQHTNQPACWRYVLLERSSGGYFLCRRSLRSRSELLRVTHRARCHNALRPATSRGVFATLNASVIPNGAATTVWFQYGLTTNYGSVTSSTNLVGNSLLIVTNLTSGLVPLSNYHFRAVASNSLGTVFGADFSFSTPLFATTLSSGLPSVTYSSVALGDLFNHGMLDIIVTGTTNGLASGAISQIWKNLGNGTFSNINAGLPGVYYSSAAVGDFYNNGMLDILLTGTTNGLSTGAISQIWKSLGNGNFTNIGAGLTGVYDGSVALGDYDLRRTFGHTPHRRTNQSWNNFPNLAEFRQRHLHQHQRCIAECGFELGRMGGF